MVDRLASLAAKDTAYREAKANLAAELRRKEEERLAYLKVERDIEAYMARQEGYSLRKIAAAMHTKATGSAYEAIASGEAYTPIDLKREYTEEFYVTSTGKPGQFVIAPPAADLKEFTEGLHSAGTQTHATYYYDSVDERIHPVDQWSDGDGRTNPVLKYVMQTKGYLGRATDWAKENVGV